jgi:glycerol-3-phosphate acyltransferase PlsY
VTYVLVVLSYLAGSIPSSYVIGKVFHGIDLRQHGSGNLGATNAFRVMGWKAAVPVVFADVGKGALPVILFPRLAPDAFGWTLAYGAGAILGHMFSVWVGFRGGKGIATSAGVFLGLAPWAVLGGLVVWLAVTFPSGYVSVGSIASAVVLPALVAFTPHQGGAGLVWFSVGLGAVVIWAHRKNIRRLARGEEHRFGRGKSASEKEARGGEFNT